MQLLARADFSDPAFLAILIGWVMAVTLHEFGHNLAGYFGGDTTIRDEGRLTLNPLQYVDPFMTIILPVLFLLIGGIPLPGGATRVDPTRLRTRQWESAVYAAGPFMNLAIFAILAALMTPAVGLFNWNLDANDWTTAQKFVSAMAFLQLLSVFLNLIPIPGLDGFGIINPYLPRDLQERLAAPHLRSLFLFGFFMLMVGTPVMGRLIALMHPVMGERLFVLSLQGFREVFSR
jgi:Zn-dependent protease